MSETVPQDGWEAVTAGEVECCARCLYLARQYPGLTLGALRALHLVSREMHGTWPGERP